MTATDKLRRMLDERVVEWTANDGEYVKETCWTYMGELTAAFAEYNDGTTRFACDTWCFTPKQAIAATLGNGECELEPIPALLVTMNMLNEVGWGKCSECGHATPDWSNYCSNCGKAVKQ